MRTSIKMVDLFVLKLILSFIIGSFWITLLSVFAEKLGTRIGGATAGIPATMVVALFFMGWTQTPEIASESTTVVPLVVGVNALFAVIFVLFLRFGYWLSLFVSLLFWFIVSYVLVVIKFNNFIYSILAFIFFLSISYYIFEKMLNIKSKRKQKLEYTLNQILFRGVISGIVIVFAVILAKLGGPLLGGIFASFPALTVALIIIMHFSHNLKFISGFLKNFIISGTINVVLFTIAIRYTYLFIGLVLGTIISLLLSFLSAYLTYQFINKKML